MVKMMQLPRAMSYRKDILHEADSLDAFGPALGTCAHPLTQSIDSREMANADFIIMPIATDLRCRAVARRVHPWPP